jgi:hypothetical protein
MADLLNDRNELLYTAPSRVTGATVAISSGVATTLVVPKGATVTTPSSLSLQANTAGYVTPSFSWSYRFSDTGGWTNISGTANTITFACDAAFLTAAGTNTLVQFKVDVIETSGILGVNGSSYTLALPILREGENGTSGINNIVLYLYRRTTANIIPEVITTGNTTYTFSSGQAVGQPSGWSQAVPGSASGSYLWQIQVVAASVTNSYAFANTLWSTPILFAQDGSAGADGYNSAQVYAYQRSATALTSNPGTVDYSFTTGTITTATLANSWSKTIPAGTDPLYVTLATAYSKTSGDTIQASEWAAPVLLVQNGADGTNGINTATVFLYARNSNSSTAPTLDTAGSITYAFATGVITGIIPTGWYTTLPAEASGSVIWVVQATAAANTTTDTIANTEWAAPVILAQKGIDGTAGIRGSRQLYSTTPGYSAAYTYKGNTAGAASYAVKATDLIAAAVAGSIPTTPIQGDTVTFSGTSYVYTITFNGTTWVTPGTVIDGSLLVTGSVTAAKINSNGLSIKDGAGATILDAGNSTVNSTLSISPVTGAGFRAGDLTWNSTGERTGGKGVAITPGGLLGHNGTKTTFAIDANTGDVEFSGNIDAASITTGKITASQIDSRGLDIRDSSNNVILAAGTPLATSYLTNASFAPYYHYDFNDNTEGFTLSGVNHYISNSILGITATTGDPIIETPNINMRGDVYHIIRIKIRRWGTGLGSWDGGIFYSTTTHGYSESYKGQVPYIESGDTSWHILDIDMHNQGLGAPDWFNSTITKVRFDFGGAVGDVFQIDWIAFGRYTTASKIDSNNISTYIADLAVNTLQIAGTAVTLPVGATAAGSGANASISLDAGTKVFISGYAGGTSTPEGVLAGTTRTTSIIVSGAASGTLASIVMGYVGMFDGTSSINYPAACPIMAIYTAPVTGTYTFTVTYSRGAGPTGVQVIGLKR